MKVQNTHAYIDISSLLNSGPSYFSLKTFCLVLFLFLNLLFMGNVKRIYFFFELFRHQYTNDTQTHKLTAKLIKEWDSLWLLMCLLEHDYENQRILDKNL